jgi:exonuclease III
LAEKAIKPTIPGYTLLEERRANSNRGGIAMYISKSLKVEAHHCNEYISHARVILHDSTKVNIANVYLPPTTSLTKRNIDE